MLFACATAVGEAVPERTRSVQETSKVFYPFTPAKLALKPGEKLEYEARWMGFPAGTMTLECRWVENVANHEAYNVRARIIFNKLASSFYSVDNDAVSIIDKRDGASDQFVLKRSEGPVSYSEHVVYDYEKMLATYTRQSPNKPEEKHIISVQLLDKVVDPLSFLYYLRGAELAPFKDVSLLVNTSQRNWNLAVRTLKSTRITVPRGTYDALKIEPVASFPGLIERKGRMYLYVEENSHIPLLIKTDIPIGSISFSLIKSENSPLDDGTVAPVAAGGEVAGDSVEAQGPAETK
jgi:hypothetical protein